MNFSYTNRFMQNHTDFAGANMMGPNVLRISEELASLLQIKKAGRILDLGCGTGLSSLFLAQQYDATVFAADLWISPTDNQSRFEQFGAKSITPLSIDVTKGLPFAHEYFDILFSVDAYHYFGRTPQMLPSLIPFVKRGGYIAVAIPAWKSGVQETPPELARFFEPHADQLDDDPAATFQTIDWWKNLWRQADGIELIDCLELSCCKQAWEEWLACPSPYAQADKGMLEVEQGKYFNITALVAKRT